MALYLQKLLAKGVCVLEITAFIACCDVMDLTQAIPLGMVTPEMLLTSIELFLAATTAANWEPYMIKEFHWVLHLADHLRKWGMLPACFTLERKHRMVKRYGTGVFNTIQYEMSLHREVLNHELAKLRQPDLFRLGVFLVNPRPAGKKICPFLSDSLSIQLEHCLVSNAVHLQPDGYAYRKDLVLVKNVDGSQQWDAGVVWLHVELNGQLLTMVFMYTLAKYDEELYTATWNVLENPMFINTADILCSLVYTEDKSAVNAFIPFQFR